MLITLFRTLRRVLPGIAFILTLCSCHVYAQNWVGTWSDSITGTTSLTGNNFSCRFIGRASLSGSSIRIRLSNVFGDAPISFKSVYVGIRTSTANVSNNTQVTFSGSNSVSIGQGNEVTSDTVPLAVSAQSDLAVSLYVPGSVDSFPYHVNFTSQYCSAFDGSAGDHTADTSGSAFTSVATTVGWLTAIDIVAPDQNSVAIAAIGDSITDGYNVATDSYGAWVDVLSQRLKNASADRSILNAGISGNTVFQSGGNGQTAVTRFGRDVLEQSGLKYVILFEGTNDINLGAAATDLENNLQSLANIAHSNGLVVIGATITPRHNGWAGDQNSKDAIRDAVNQWIRTTSAYDRYIDFDAVIRDPNNPEQMNANYLNAAVDWIHPNVAGYAAMANAIDLTDFSLTGPSNGIVSGKIYRLVNSKSGLTLDCYDQGNGTGCYGWQNYGDPNQQWQIVSLGDGSYKIINQQSFRALDAYGYNNGTGAYVWDYVGGVDQKWRIFANGDGTYRLLNVKSENALDVYDTTNGAAAYVWRYVSGSDQNWTLDQLN